jgi:hypothetical protein
MRKIQFIHEGKRITHIELFTLINGTDIVIPIEVIDEIFLYITSGKTFKEVLHLDKCFHCNYEPKIPNYISVSISEVLGMLENAVFYYEILTNRVIDAEPSIDQLHRHVLEDFGYYETNSYDIVTMGKKQYLSMTLRLDEFSYEDDDEATPENMNMYFAETVENGKLIIPKSFVDEMYIVNPEDDTDYETIEVEMRFDKVDGDIDLLQYITFV